MLSVVEAWMQLVDSKEGIIRPSDTIQGVVSEARLGSQQIAQTCVWFLVQSTLESEDLCLQWGHQFPGDLARKPHWLPAGIEHHRWVKGDQNSHDLMHVSLILGTHSCHLLGSIPNHLPGPHNYTEGWHRHNKHHISNITLHLNWVSLATELSNGIRYGLLHQWTNRTMNLCFC